MTLVRPVPAPVRLLCVLLLALSPAVLPGAAWQAAFADANGAAVPDVVVSLTPLDAPAPPADVSRAPMRIVQKDGEFVPFLSAIRTGTRVEFPNRDGVQHHVYSLSPAKRFEIPLYGGDATHGEVFPRAGLVTLGCNIHDWMLAYIVVVETPWFAIAGADGRVRIADLPPGRYRCEIWHPRLTRALVEEIELATNAPAAPDAGSVAAAPPTPPVRTLQLKPDRRVRRSLEGRASGYR